MAAHAWKQAPAVGAVHIAGFSMGGFVAQEMLVADPARVAGIALINSATGVDSAEQLVIREKTIAAAERDFGRLCERIIDFGLHPDHRTEADLRQAMRGTLEAAGVANCIQHNRAVMTRRDLGPALAQSRAPLLVITSDNDAVVERSRAEAVLGLRPDATLSVIADAGHMTILENPRAVAAALNAWLRG
jgi:pimeloyl-ACP methyl ester carboxylesterase